MGMLEEDKRELLFFLRKRVLSLSEDHRVRSINLLNDTDLPQSDVDASYYMGKANGLVDATIEIDRILSCSDAFEEHKKQGTGKSGRVGGSIHAEIRRVEKQ